MGRDAGPSLNALTRYLARQAGLRPSRRMGQSFLINGRIARRIVEFAEIRPGETVLEIGSGLGALTLVLGESDARTLAIERDRRLIRVLAPHLSRSVQLALFDARRLDWTRLQLSSPVLVSNLPYPLTSEVLVSLCSHRGCVRRAILMVQREVADRLAAPPSSPNRGGLSVLVQLCYEITQGPQVGPKNFWPSPKVESRVVRLRPRRDWAGSPEVSRLLREGFAKRRKTLRNSLGVGKRWPPDLLERAGLPDNCRAQELTNDEWVRLAALASDL